MGLELSNTSITKFCIGAIILVIALGVYKVIKKWKKQKKIMAVLSGIAYAATAVIIITLMVIVNNEAEEAFNHIKNSHPLSVDSVTYGEMIDNIDPDAKWKLIETENDQYAVEVTMVNTTMIDDEKYTIQFRFDGVDWPDKVKKSTPFEVSFVGKGNQKETSLEDMKNTMYDFFLQYVQDVMHAELHPSVAEQILGSEQYGWGLSQKEAADEEETDTEETMTTYIPETTTYPVETTEEVEKGFQTETYAKYYADCLEGYSTFPICDYSLADVDDDSFYELIVSYGTCSADMNNSVYDVDENGDSCYIGEFSGELQFVRKVNSAGIYGIYEHMGNLHIYDITYGNFLKCEEIWSGDSEECNGDIEMGAEIKYYERTDEDGLDTYIQ